MSKSKYTKTINADAVVLQRSENDRHDAWLPLAAIDKLGGLPWGFMLRATLMQVGLVRPTAGEENTVDIDLWLTEDGLRELTELCLEARLAISAQRKKT